VDREIPREATPEAEILKGRVSVAHVPPLVSRPPHVSASYPMRRAKGKSPRRLLREQGHLNKECRGRHLWARGLFVASSGDVRDEVIRESIRTRELREDDDDFRVSDG
jgi:putative transposase